MIGGDHSVGDSASCREGRSGRICCRWQYLIIARGLLMFVDETSSLGVALLNDDDVNRGSFSLEGSGEAMSLKSTGSR